MGVTELWRFLNEKNNNSSCCSSVSINSLRGSIIGIDLSVWVAQSSLLKQKIHLNSKNNHSSSIFSHLQLFLTRIINLIRLGIIPVFISDGIPPPFKQKGGKKGEKINKIISNNSGYNSVEYQQIKKLLGLMGIQLINPVYGEGEAFAAKLNELGLINGVVSPDADCLLFGAKSLINSFINQQKGGKAIATIYNINKIEKNVGIGRNKMIIIALLLGSDYCNGVKGIGMERVIKLIESIEDQLIIERLRNIIQGKLSVDDWDTLKSEEINNNEEKENERNYELLSREELEGEMKGWGLKPLKTRKNMIETLTQINKQLKEECTHTSNNNNSPLNQENENQKLKKKEMNLDLKRIENNKKTLIKIKDHYSTRLEEYNRVVDAYINPLFVPSPQSIPIHSHLPNPNYSNIYSFLINSHLNSHRTQFLLLQLHCSLALQRRAAIKHSINNENKNNNINIPLYPCSHCNLIGHYTNNCPYSCSSSLSSSSSSSSVCYLCASSSHTDIYCTSPSLFFDCLYKPIKIIKQKKVQGERRYLVKWERNNINQCLIKQFSFIQFNKHKNNESNDNNESDSNKENEEGEEEEDRELEEKSELNDELESKEELFVACFNENLFESEENGELIQLVLPNLIQSFDEEKRLKADQKQKEKELKERIKIEEKQRVQTERRMAKLKEKQIKEEEKLKNKEEKEKNNRKLSSMNYFTNEKGKNEKKTEKNQENDVRGKENTQSTTLQTMEKKGEKEENTRKVNKNENINNSTSNSSPLSILISPQKQRETSSIINKKTRDQSSSSSLLKHFPVIKASSSSSSSSSLSLPSLSLSQSNKPVKSVMTLENIDISDCEDEGEKQIVCPLCSLSFSSSSILLHADQCAEEKQLKEDQIFANQLFNSNRSSSISSDTTVSSSYS